MSRIYLTTDKDQVIDTDNPIQPTTINLFLAISNNNTARLQVLLYSLLKYSESNFNIYVMVNANEDELEEVKSRFNFLFCDRLNLTMLTNELLEEWINTQKLNFQYTSLTYARMLVPTLFPNLDKILYLDYDAVPIKNGIEWLYNIDLKDKLIAVSDGSIRCNKNEVSDMVLRQHRIFKNFGDFYFNSGVILYNIPKLIKAGKDKEMLDILKYPPNSQIDKELEDIRRELGYGEILYLQHGNHSFMNWIFEQEEIMKFNKIFNSEEDNLFTINKNRVEILKNKWGFKDYQDYFDNIVIAHYCGTNKPWYYNPIPKNEIYKMDLHERYRSLERECNQLRVNNNLKLE